MAANSGKYLEQSVDRFYDSIKDPTVVLHRFNDSASGRNLTAAQPADFIIVSKGVPILLECKSVKHDFRLTKFAQHPRMVRWGLTGVIGVVLIHHYIKDVYRVVSIPDLEIGQASFDLRFSKELNFSQAMGVIFL